MPEMVPCSTSSICSDCLFWLANGETDPEWTEEERANYISEVNRMLEGAEITLGMMAEDHGCTEPRIQPRKDAQNAMGILYVETPGRFEFGSWRRPFPNLFARYDIVCDSGFMRSFFNEEKAMTWANDNRGEIADDCECEQLGFSWSPCHLCNSNLGGDRFAATFWVPKGEI